MKIESIKDVQMLYVSKEEALSIIKSLTSQLLANSPNTGRLESYIGNTIFSIAIFDPSK